MYNNTDDEKTVALYTSSSRKDDLQKKEQEVSYVNMKQESVNTAPSQIALINQSLMNGKKEKKTGKIILIVIIAVLAVALLVCGILLINAKKESSKVESGGQQGGNVSGYFIPSQFICDKDFKWIPVEGKLGKENDGSIDDLAAISKLWVLKEQGQVMGSELLIINSGKASETKLRSLPQYIQLNNKLTTVNGIYAGKIEFINGNWADTKDVLCTMNGDKFVVGIPYTEETVGIISLYSVPGETTMDIQEFQFDMKWDGSELELKYGYDKAVYVPYREAGK